MKPGKTVGTTFRALGSNREPTVPDELPVASVIKNGIITSVVCVVAATDVLGVYSVMLTLPSSWVDGDLVDLDIQTVIQGYNTNALVRLGIVSAAASVVASAVRTELSAELGRMDVAVSTRSTLKAQDIPEGLTATEVWAAEGRTLTEAPGLTNLQAEQLRKVAQLHGVGAELVVTETTRTAGDVSQTLTTDDDGNTTVSAA